MSSVANGDDSTRRGRADAPAYQNARDLKRMRRTATGLLALLLALLFASVVWQGAHPWLAWLRAFAEAGTAGAIADWYAVVVLFRRPFGLPVPHTAIIARNQQRIAESLGSFVEENFLTPELIIGRLRGHNAARALAQWLVVPDHSRAIADIVADSLPGLMEGIGVADVERFFDRLVLPQLRTLDVSHAAGSVLKVLTEGGRHQPLLDHGLRALEKWLTANVDMIKAKFSAASRYTPVPLDVYIVRKFVEGIVALLHEVAANPDHELRRQFDAAVQDLIVQLQTSPVHRRAGQSVLRDCIRYFHNGNCYRVLLDYVRTRVTADSANEHSALRGATAGMLASLARSVDSEPAIQQKLNAWWLELAHELVVRYRCQLSVLITEVVKSWDADEVSGKIEAEIGRDLQYIRINGTLVGGAVGVLLHAATLIATR